MQKSWQNYTENTLYPPPRFYSEHFLQYLLYHLSIHPSIYSNSFILFYLFIFWLRWVFVAAHGLSLFVASGNYSSLQCAGFSLRWLLLLRSMDSRHVGFSKLWLAGSVVVAHRLSSCDARA